MSSDLSPDERQQLKQWLVGELASISDADTDILADYVLALLNADAPEPELEKELHEQLTDFLEDNTAKFVSSFMATLRSKSYVAAFPLPAQNGSASAPTGGADAVAPAPVAMAMSSPSKPAGAELVPSDRPVKRSRSTSPSSSSNLLPAAKTSRLASPNPSAASGSMLPGAPGEAAASGEARLPCFDYHQRGYCPRGAACIWVHDMPGGSPMIGPGMDGGRMMMNHQQGFPNGGRGGGFQGGRGGRGGGFQGGNMGPPGGYIGGYVPPGGFEGVPRGSPSGSSSSPHHPGQQGQQFFDPAMFMDPSFSMLQPNGLPIPGGPPGGGLVYPPQQGNGFGRGGFNGGGRGNNFNNGPRGGGAGGGRGGRTQMPEGAVRKPPKERNTLTLVVSSIPNTHLNLPSITEHFSKFGTVTNVAIDVRSSRALVSFETNEQAYKAWKSEEVIFGSRFVTVLWHAPMEGHGAKGQEALAKSKDAVAVLVGSGGQLSKEDAAKKQRKLEGLIAKQKVLMARLGNTTAPEAKADLMEQLRGVIAEMDEVKSAVSAPGSPSVAGGAASPVASGSRSVVFNKPAPSSDSPMKEEDEASRLDRELTEGRMDGVEEASPSMNREELLAMLAQKKAEAAALGLDSSLPTYTPRGRGRGRGAPRGAPRGRGAAAFGGTPGRGSMKLDLRTKSLAVVGDGLVNDEDARKAVETWYEGGGGLDNIRVDDGDSRMVVTFKSRGAAEAALARGNNIVDLPTHVALSWYNAPPTIVAPQPKVEEDDGMDERR